MQTKHPITGKPIIIEVSHLWSTPDTRGYRACVFKANGVPYVAWERRARFLWWSWLEYIYDGMVFKADQLAKYLVYYKHLRVADAEEMEPEFKSQLDTP